MQLNQREQLLWQVQVAGFAVDETRLYLDTHCDDPEALVEMARYQEMLRRATAEYENRYGPLTAQTPERECSKWQWVSCPWPWEWEG